MRSTDPLNIEKIPFSEPMEEPERQETKKPENPIYEPNDLGNGYVFLYTEQIRELDEKIRNFGYRTPELRDREEKSYIPFDRGYITETLRLLRILSVPRTDIAVYTVDDLKDIEDLCEPIYASITEEFQASEEPEKLALLLTNKNDDELIEALNEIPDELVKLVRDREWRAAYDQWNAAFFLSPPATWFYVDTDMDECCRIIMNASLCELKDWLMDGTAPESLITHVDLPHKNVGCNMSGRFNFEEQCIEMCSNSPLKGLTIKLIKSEEAELGFYVEDFYPDAPYYVY